MKTYTYNFEISTLIAQFLDSLNDVVIKRWKRNGRYDQATQDGPDILPTILYSPKEKVIQDTINNQAKMRLPVIAFTAGGIQRDKNRVFNKLQGPSFTKYENPKYPGIGQPVPIDLTINMSIMSKFQEDIDQIVTNFIPYSDPYYVVSWPDPYNKNQEIRTVIMWSEQVSYTYPTDTTYNDMYRIIGETSFVIKGFLFKAEGLVEDGIIHNIYSHFHAVSSFYCEFAPLSSMSDYTPETTDTWIISGRPQLTDVAPYVILANTPTTLTLIGSMLDYTSAVFLSGSMFNTVYPLTASSLSATISSIIGHRVEPLILSQNVMQVTTPAIAGLGYFDVVAINDAGVGYLTLDSYNNTVIPEPSGSGWQVYQKPCISGVQVVSI